MTDITHGYFQVSVCVFAVTSKAGRETQSKHSSDVSLNRISENSLLQTQNRLIHEAGHQAILYILISRPAERTAQIRLRLHDGLLLLGLQKTAWECPIQQICSRLLNPLTE